MGALDRLRSWNLVRVAVNRVMCEDDPSAVVELLREFPGEARRVARRAKPMADTYPLYALLLGVGLARSGAVEAVDLLRSLADREFGWYRLGEEALRHLRQYLEDRGEVQLLYAVRQRLDEHQVGWFLPTVSAGGFLDEFAGVTGEGPLRSAVQRIADFVEDVALGDTVAGQGLENAAAAAEILWDRGRAEEALQLWAMVAVAEPATFKDSELLRPIAEALPGWIPRPGSLRIAGLPEGFGVDALSLPLLPVPPRVVRAADLLADYPHTGSVEPLRRAWLAIDDLVRRDPSDEERECDPSRLMSAQSIAAALGTCAALDRQMRVLVRDEAGRRRRYDVLGREVDRRNRLVEEYRKLVDLYHAGEAVVEAIRKLRDEIAERDSVIARARNALREELSPAALLLHTVADEQAYPLEVRQGAAWGLHRILEDGGLDEAARDRVDRTLRAVLHDEEIDESALRDCIATRLPKDDDRVRELLVAAERYAADRDGDELAVSLHRLAPEVPSLQEEIRDAVDAARRSQGRGEFGERAVRLLPGARLLEFVGALRRGLCWMVELLERRTGRDRWLEDNLRWIAALVGEELPGVTDFLSRYPLRLMPLDRHRQILGQYSRDKVQVQLWTRYTPPRWFRGANPAELGKVHRRYFDLDDRSAPNAMGLHYRLFEHPVLVLPVLYHEFLHYGGPEGHPEQGIENETEVLLREVLFARHLLARLAPADDAELPAYESALAEAIKRTELVGLGQQLFFEFEDDGFLGAINEQIAQTYGEGLDAAAAKAEVGRKIEHWNRTIDLENEINEAKRSWCPEIDWPRLGAHETGAVSDHFRAVLTRTLQQDHRLDSERRNKVLADPVCRHHRDEWSAYRRRRGAVAQFARHFAPRGLGPHTLQAIVHRFELEGPRAIPELLGLFRALDSTDPRDS